MAKITYQNWGVIPYSKAFEKQTLLFDSKVKQKLNGNNDTENYLIFCQHPHVYTLGKHGKINNLLVDKDFLTKISATYYQTNRGGDITYHGFGQIVGYPVLDLEQFHLGLKDYITLIEQAIIDLMLEYGILCKRLHGATGVWIKNNAGEQDRKICAIGVKASRFVTMHGFALNVNTDLSYFNYINPCGFVDKTVTSMQKELANEMNVQEIEDRLLHHIITLLK
ncbi:MAG: lipoyl(octanoyl) transferase LipB [Bacteroidales bacterium]|jgi:lipoyl(octanoyl) transferase|nr:lipoyl(octanoyl) transferase LipB [Bacteroidales bacterium]